MWSGVRSFLPELPTSRAKWFFMKAIHPVVSYLRAKGHRVFSYLDDFFGEGATARKDHPATEADTAQVEINIRYLFARLSLNLHPKSATFLWNGGWRSSESWSTPSARSSYSLRPSSAR
jgi:hypothetical protein